MTRFALLCLLVALSSAGASLAAPSDSTVVDSAAAVHDSTHAPRVVRRFPEVEVRAPLYDLRSSQTVHVMDEAALRSMPVDCLEDLLALQPGVVAQGEELHVRGGRTGERGGARGAQPSTSRSSTTRCRCRCSRSRAPIW